MSMKDDRQDKREFIFPKQSRDYFERVSNWIKCEEIAVGSLCWVVVKKELRLLVVCDGGARFVFHFLDAKSTPYTFTRHEK